MKYGYGSPYVEVHTSLGKVVENIVEFVYRYSQEEDDTCQITIEASEDDVTLPDRPEFQEGVILKVLWGYIGSNDISKSREVVIRNTKAHYSEKKISLDLLCTNRASLLKHTSSKKIRKGSVKDIADEITKDTGLQPVVVSSGGQPIFTEGALGSRNINPLELRVYSQLPQAGKTDYQILEYAAQNDPTGPLELVGRDNQIIIQRRNLNQKPLRSYTYGDTTGLLLNFTPESKNLSRQSSSMNINVSGINPNNKTEYEGDTNNLNNPDVKLGDQIDTPPRYINNDGNTDSATGTASKPISSGNKVKPEGSDKVPKNADANNKLPPKELQAVAISKGGQPVFTEGALGRGNVNPLEAKGQPPIDYNKTEHSIEDDIDTAMARALHDQSLAALKKNPAEVEVVGDPLLESGKVVTILNVSKKYSGNYYIESCDHTIVFGQAYTCNMKLSKNATGNTGTDSPLKTQSSEPINNQIGPDSIEPGTYTLEVPDDINATAPIKLDTGE